MMVYILTLLGALGALQVVSGSPAFQGKFRRSITGGTAGLVSYGWLENYANVQSVFNASVDGELGFYGYIFVLGLVSLIGVWVWNLIGSRQYLVR
jgi:hypothetical protein